MPGTALVSQVEAWIAEDPDPLTRAELQSLLDVAHDGDQAARIELADRFSHPLAFGTAGLRGAMGAGPNRMNRVVVTRAAAGLAAYLKGRRAEGPVVVGYDARHNSEVFARDTAEVMSGAGIEVLLLPRPLPTPLLAFAIRHLSCSAGVMVTASHNPAQDNGYKVYLGDGSQIVSPTDEEISGQIHAVGPLASIPRSQGATVLGEDVVEAYVKSVTSFLPHRESDLNVVYTPMHGVGGEIATHVLGQAGFNRVASVPEQFEPDPDFPTVAFPNPEEPGALDLAFALAEQVGADLVIANDPDADRVAIGVPVPAAGLVSGLAPALDPAADSPSPLRGSDRGVGPVSRPGTSPVTYRRLTGDEVGAIIGHRLLQRGAKGTYATSIVSSSLLGAMAAKHGQPYVETLTGFKWIGRIPGLVFGYEEALGYCVDPSHVRDKDGISAALLIAHIAADLRSRGSSLLTLLDEIAGEHGLYATDQLSVRVDDLARIDDALTHLRAHPPTTLGPSSVVRMDDLACGSPTLPPTPGLRLALEDGGRVIVRPSGTEPKLKVYFEVVVPTGGDVDSARALAAERLAALKGDVADALGLTDA